MSVRLMKRLALFLLLGPAAAYCLDPIIFFKEYENT